MNQRLAFSAAAVALAACAAAFRPWHIPQVRQSLTTSEPSALASAGLAGAEPLGLASAGFSSAAAPAPVSASASPPAPPRAEHGKVSQAAALSGSGVPGDAGRAVVYVAGEVRRPGVYCLPARARAVDALRAAGGPAADADLVAVNLAEPLTDGEEIVVQPKGASFAVPASSRSASTARRRSRQRCRRNDGVCAPDGHRHSSRSQKAPPTETVDLNRADAATLEELPGVGPALAERIVDFRDLNGPFASVDDLLDVNGMSDSRLEEIEPYATVH